MNGLTLLFTFMNKWLWLLFNLLTLMKWTMLSHFDVMKWNDEGWLFFFLSSQPHLTFHEERNANANENNSTNKKMNDCWLLSNLKREDEWLLFVQLCSPWRTCCLVSCVTVHAPCTFLTDLCYSAKTKTVSKKDSSLAGRWIEPNLNGWGSSTPFPDARTVLSWLAAVFVYKQIHNIVRKQQFFHRWPPI